MKLAVLILSYRKPDALPLHAEYWRGVADLFIHVDAKVPEDRIPKLPEARFVERRSIFWGGWVMVEATFDLIQAALAAGGYQRCVLISDDTAPLLPVGEVAERLAEEREFIWIFDKPSDPFQERYSRFYCYDHPASAVATRAEDRAFDADAVAMVARMGRLMLRGKKPITFRHGDQWWALSRKALEPPLTAYRTDEWLRESFCFSAVPDEHFFHSTVAGSWRERFLYTERRAEAGRPFRSIDTLREHVPDGFLFARKVDCDVPQIAELVKTGRLPPANGQAPGTPDLGRIVSAGAWKFGNGERWFSTSMRLLPDGSISGYGHPHEARWEFRQGKIHLLAHDGRISSVLSPAEPQEQGGMEFRGRSLLDPRGEVILILRRSKPAIAG